MPAINIISLSRWGCRAANSGKRIFKPTLIVFLTIALLLPQLYFPAAPAAAQGSVATPMISAGYSHSLGLKTDGTLWAWGWNGYGQLGDGTRADKTTPVQVSGLNGVVAVSGGWDHSLALKQDGTVWAWGSNNFGQLGDGTTTRRTTPVQVSDLTGVVAVSGGVNHSLALKQDGTVWAWGYNFYGQLGDGTTVSKTSPVQVSGLTGVLAVSGGSSHSLALKQDGTVWAWGRNNSGQLGDRTTIDRTTPVQVSEMYGVVAVSSGGQHSLALKQDGTVWAWGRNNYGQLGDGTTANKTSPVQVSGLTGVVAVSGGDYHSLALKQDGTLWAWGYNWYGQLGDGTFTRRTTPVQVSGLTGVVTVSGGGYYSLALKQDGTVWAWGDNYYGQLGDGTRANKFTPVQSLINLGETEPAPPPSGNGLHYHYSRFTTPGIPLEVKVFAGKTVSITLSVGGYEETLTGRAVSFTVDTAALEPGRYDLTITAGGTVYEDWVEIVDPEIYREIIGMLDELRELSKAEMRQMANLVAGTLVDIMLKEAKQYLGETAREAIVETEMAKRILSKLQESIMGETAGVVLDKGGIFGNLLPSESQQEFVSLVETVAGDLEDELHGYMGGAVTAVSSAVLNWVSGGQVNERTFRRYLAENVVGPAVYSVFCRASRAVDARHEELLGNLNISPGDIENTVELLRVGRRAILNSRADRIYHLDILGLVTAAPGLDYFNTAHHRAMNPGGWFGMGKYNPSWVWDTTIADMQALLTLLAFIDWIESAPDRDRDITPQAVPAVAAIIKAAKIYIKYVQLLEKSSPYIISGGMAVGTTILSRAIDYKHETIIQAVTDNSSPSSLAAALTIQQLQTYETFSVPEDLVITVAADREDCQPGETVALTLTIENPGEHTVEDLVWWLIIPEADLVEKEVITVQPQSQVSMPFEFIPQEEGLYRCQVFLSYLTEMLDEDMVTVFAGEAAPAGAVLRVEPLPVYQPGQVSLDLEISNIGRQVLEPLLLYNDSELNLPALPPGESIMQSVSLDYPEPGQYDLFIGLRLDGDGEDDEFLDWRLVKIVVEPVDIFTAFCTTDKLFYELGETVNVETLIRDGSGDNVTVPYTVEVTTPSGNLINLSQFTATEEGTYLVRVVPAVAGGRNLAAKTFFLVERQSSLEMDAVFKTGGVEIKVTTDTGLPVEGAVLTIGEETWSTDEEGIFFYVLHFAENLFITAGKTGFDPGAVFAVNYGDIDGNWVINLTDVILLLRHTVGLTELSPEQLVRAGVSGLEEPNVADAIFILRRVARLIDKFPVE